MRLVLRRLRLKPGGMVWTVIDQSVVSGGTFLTTVFIARLVGVEQFGYYSLGILFTLLVQNLQASAIIAPTMAIRSQLQRHRMGAYDRSIVEQSAVFSGLCAVIGCVSILIAKHIVNVPIDVMPFSLAIATSAFQDFQRRHAFARGVPIHAAVCDTIRLGSFALALIASWVFTVDGANASYVLWILAATNVPSILYSLCNTGVLAGPSNLRRYVIRRHLRFSLWMTGQALLQYVTTNAQFFLVGGVLSAAAVGALRAAMNLANLVNVLLLALENSVPVRMAEAAISDGAAGVRHLVRQTTLLVTLVFTPLLVMSALFGGFLMHRVYGANYGSYGSLVFWWMLINFVSAIAIPLKSALRTFEQPERIFVAQIASSVIALGGTLGAIHKWGILGGPVVLLMALISFNCAIFYAYGKTAKWKLFAGTAK